MCYCIFVTTLVQQSVILSCLMSQVSVRASVYSVCASMLVTCCTSTVKEDEMGIVFDACVMHSCPLKCTKRNFLAPSLSYKYISTSPRRLIISFDCISEPHCVWVTDEPPPFIYLYSSWTHITYTDITLLYIRFFQISMFLRLHHSNCLVAHYINVSLKVRRKYCILFFFWKHCDLKIWMMCG